MKAKSFEKVKNQIGYCGIWCGSCVVGNGVLTELTGKYEEIIRKYALEEWAPKNFDFKEFKKGLVSIQAMPLCKGCLKSGGRSGCEMRACALKKNISDCSECNQPKECKNHETLQKMRTGARDAGLFVKTENIVQQKFIEECFARLQNEWPSCILFMTD